MKCPKCAGLAPRYAGTGIRQCVKCGYKFIDNTEPEWESFATNKEDVGTISFEDLTKGEQDD